MFWGYWDFMTHTTGLRTAIMLATLLLLSGCVTFDAQLQVDTELRVDGEFTLLISRSDLMEAQGSEAVVQAEEQLPALFAAPETPDGVTVVPLNTVDDVGVQVIFDQVPSTELNYTDSLPLISRQDDQVFFEMLHPFITELGEYPEMITSAVVEIQLPGPIITAEGASISGDTARWQITANSPQTLTANATYQPGFGANPVGFNWQVTLAVLLVLLALASATLVAVSLREGSQQTRP